MKVVIIAYDLKDIKPGDNDNVKEALLKATNTTSLLQGINYPLFQNGFVLDYQALQYWLRLKSIFQRKK